MKRDKDVLWIATPFNMRRPRRDTKDREGLRGHVISYTIDEPGFRFGGFSNG
jgi:hypothetical protein